MREHRGFVTASVHALIRQVRLASWTSRYIRVLYLGQCHSFRNLKITWFDLRIEQSVPDHTLSEAQKPVHIQLDSIVFFFFNRMLEEFHLHFWERSKTYCHYYNAIKLYLLSVHKQVLIFVFCAFVVRLGKSLHTPLKSKGLGWGV